MSLGAAPLGALPLAARLNVAAFSGVVYLALRVVDYSGMRFDFTNASGQRYVLIDYSAARYDLTDEGETS